MKKQEFLNVIKLGPIMLDGATGTNLQKAGMPSDICPEVWVLENKEKLQVLQRSFYKAGSDIIYAFSFGANRIKLDRHGLASDSKSVEEINMHLAQISCTVRDQMKQDTPQGTYLVAGNLSPTGLFLKPAGELGFDELVDIYREQVRGLIAADVDLIAIETMLDLAQTRAAVIAVRSESDLPIMASLTVEKNGKTLSGDSIKSSLLALAALDVQAFGLNCSFGPEHMIDFFEKLPLLKSCVLLAKPNAGMPHLDEFGQTYFDMQPEHFAVSMTRLLPLGVKIVGGCCGTTPAHIAALRAAVSEYVTTNSSKQDDFAAKAQPLLTGKLLQNKKESTTLICSSKTDVSLKNWCDFPILTCDNLDNLVDDLVDMADDQPDGICVDLTEFKNLRSNIIADIMAETQLYISVPIIFICDDAQTQCQIARYYNGLTAFISNRDIGCGNTYYLNR